MKRIFTGALTLLLFAGAAQAQTKDSVRHHRGGREHVAKQLNLTADQQEKLKAIRKSQHEEMKALKENTSLTAEQQKAKRAELHKKYADQSTAIYTPAQKEQMEKMKAEWKAKGKEAKKGAKRDAKKGEGHKHGKGSKAHRKGGDFAKDLNLSDAQKSQVAKLRSDFKAQFESVRNDKSLSEEQKKAKMKSLKEEQKTQMKSILTKEQIEKAKAAKKEHKAKRTK